MNEYKDLEIIRKTTRTYALEFSKDNVATNIEGWTVYFVVKGQMQDTDANAKINKTITIHTDAPNGKIQIDLDITDTDLVAGSYYYTLDVKDDEDNEGVLFYGRIVFKESVLQDRT